MRATSMATAIAVLLMAGSPGTAVAVGEPIDGFPNAYERMVHLLINRARSDPDAALAACTNCADVDLGCYLPTTPLQWNEDLNRAARFHGVNLTDSICGLQDNSPCNLDPDIGSEYPTVCDGSVSCACASTQACGATCFSDPSSCSDPWERLALFGVSGGQRGENMALSRFDPFAVMDLWLLEETSRAACGFYCSGADCNAHRYNILAGFYRRVGVGNGGDYAVQDFWSAGALDQKIPSAAHWPETGGPDTGFRASWYDVSGAPLEAVVNVDGLCLAMAVEAGAGGNATYLRTEDTSTSSCTRYYFEFRDALGQILSYPETGSYGIGCTDWEATRPPACLSDPQVPTLLPIGVGLLLVSLLGVTTRFRLRGPKRSG